MLMSQATQTPVVTVPAEVLALAAEQGVDTVLPAVLEMTQRVFADSSVRVEIDVDPEIADDQHLLIAAQFRVDDVSQALETRYQWHRELFACCPAPLVCVFRLRMELVP